MMLTDTIKGYVDLCRVSNLPSVWTNVLCASILATGGFSWGGYLVPAASLSCFYMAGMCLNDICDAGYDSIHRPSRPIPSGRVTVGGAALLTILFFSTGFALLLASSHSSSLYAAALLLVFILLYDLYHKENQFSVLLMASCRFMVFVVTCYAVAGKLSSMLLAAGGVQFSYVIALSLVARHENSRGVPFNFPVLPLMLAGICLVDGIMLAVLVTPLWLLAGVSGSVAMLLGQRFVRGD